MTKMLRVCLAVAVLLMPWHGVSATVHVHPTDGAETHQASPLMDIGVDMGHQGHVKHGVEHHMDKHGDCSFSGHCCAVAFSSILPLVNDVPLCFNELPLANAITVILPAELRPPRISNS